VAEVARVLKPGGRFIFVTSHAPPIWSPTYWAARAFNGAMHVRNLLVSPPFIMFYLTFLLPEVKALVGAHGFAVEVRRLDVPRPWSMLRLVVATRTAPCAIR
jgi:hypothetical protein